METRKKSDETSASSKIENTVLSILSTLYAMHKDSLSKEGFIPVISKEYNLPDDMVEKVVNAEFDYVVDNFTKPLTSPNGGVFLDIKKSEFEIVPAGIKISDPNRAQKSFFKLGLKLSLKSFLIFLALIVIFLALQIVLRNSIPAIRTIALGFILLLIIRFFITALYALKIAIIRPDQSKPEYTLKEFFMSIRDTIYERGYNLLSDNAQNSGNMILTKSNLFSSKMPDPNFTDLNSFSQFWEEMPFQIEYGKLHKNFNKIFSKDDYCVISVPISFKEKGGKAIGIFENKFLLVKRNDVWFIANGFIWPY